MVTSMWKLLGELAVQYCDLATWSRASGDAESALELIEKARACLVERGWHTCPDQIELTDVLRVREDEPG